MSREPRKYTEGWLESFNPPIPEVYGDAVTYLEQIKNLYKFVTESVHHITERLRWLEANIVDIAETSGRDAALKELQIIVDELNSIDKVLKSHIALNQKEHIQMRNEYTSEYGRAIALSQEAFNKISELEENIESIISEQVHIQYGSFQAALRTMQYTIDNLNQTVHRSLQWIARLDNELLVFKKHIEDQFEKESEDLTAFIIDQIERTNADSLIVKNPLTGKPDSLTDVLQALVGGGSGLPIRASDFDNLHITCEEFDRMQITCSMFDQYAYLIFFKDLNFPPIYDKINSVEVNLQKQIDEINETKWLSILSDSYLSPEKCYEELAAYVLANHSNRIACQSFDELKIPCDEFDKKLIPCVQFDWSGGNIAW